MYRRYNVAFYISIQKYKNFSFDKPNLCAFFYNSSNGLKPVIKQYFRIFKKKNWFVTRAKENLNYEVIEIFDVSKEKDQNIRPDNDIRLSIVKDKEVILRG